MNHLKAIIVDDEPLAREGLSLRLKELPEVEVVAECRNGREALAAINDLRPDVVFLDIEMPCMSGLEMCEMFGEDNIPAIVFVAAYKRYAIEAFDLRATDYLVKPVKMSRLRESVARIQEQLAVEQLKADKERLVQIVWEVTGKDTSEIEHLLQKGESIDAGYPDKIAIKDPGNATQLIQCADIEWVEAAGDYMCVHAKGETYILRSTMKELETQLNPKLFQRIHRSSIVNVKHVVEIKSHSNGECFVSLKSGFQLKVSRGYKKKIADFI